MRRKSERTASKKSKSSPEKKEKHEKVKHSRTRRKKQSESSGSDSAEDITPVEATDNVESKSTADPPKLIKEETSKESQDQVWQVKATEVSGDVGEIQKLKICLARPSSTPERVDRSPRSKRKHSRATSSSDTQSVEGEEKKKSKRRSKRCAESKDVEKNYEGQDDELDVEVKDASPLKSVNIEPEHNIIQSTSTDETPVSTTNEETKSETAETSVISKNVQEVEDNTSECAPINDEDVQDKQDKAGSKTEDTVQQSESIEQNTAVDDKCQIEGQMSEIDHTNEVDQESVSDQMDGTDHKADTEQKGDTDNKSDTDPNGDTDLKDATNQKSDTGQKCDTEQMTDTNQKGETDKKDDMVQKSDTDLKVNNEERVDTIGKVEIEYNIGKAEETGMDKKECVIVPSRQSPVRKRSLSEEKSEILELHAEESRCESSEVSFTESQDARSKTTLDQDENVSNFVPMEVSINKNTNEISGHPGSNHEDDLATTEKIKNVQNDSTAERISNIEGTVKISKIENEPQMSNEGNLITTTNISNGDVTPLVINRKRRWGSRPSKLSTQKSITISTDILKEIMPDVKPVEFDEVIEEKKHKRFNVPEKIDRPILPKIVIDNTENVELNKKVNKVVVKDKENVKVKDSNLGLSRKISIVKEHDSIITRPPSPPKHKQSSILYITNLVRPFTLPQLKNLLQRTGRIVDNGFWIDRIKSKCYVQYDTEDQAVETRHALHGVTWPVSNPKTLHVDFSTQDDFEKAKANEETDNAQVSTIPGTVEDWLREQDIKREKGELDKQWERKAATREWDVGKNEKSKEVSRPEKPHRDERPPEKRRQRTLERSPEPARKFKKKEEEAPAKLLDDLFRKTKATPCIYWLPLSAETIAVKEEQRRQHMAEHERRLQELRRTHRRH